ncbi:MAG: carboxynorspermidine decarboxylase [Alphaproteobacteria bacterium]|nr:carboxynorspermidine decarboxylase [Alphaproteobacteria bacterium]
MPELPLNLKAALNKIDTPAYVMDVSLLKRNMIVADRVRTEAKCKVLLATKSFAMPAVFPIMRDYLDGTTASGLYEARLGFETFSKEVHVYSPAYTEGEVVELLKFSDNIYFNSIDQIKRFSPIVRAAGPNKKIGIRINPGYSKATLGGHLYDPCAPNSRFGVIKEQLDGLPWDDIDILHAHALCEALHDGSLGLIEHVGKEFGKYIRRVKEVNFGGGHFINDPGYDVDVLIKALNDFRASYPHVGVAIEPGSGLVRNAGYLVSTVLDVLYNACEIAVLDTSAACHMPDVLEVPYTPEIFGAGEAGAYPHTYVLGGKTCMTGDIIGTYSFSTPLKAGDKLVFTDMMQYSFVKNNSFNGTPLPDLAVLHEDGRYEIVRRFGYEDFKLKLCAIS